MSKRTILSDEIKKETESSLSHFQLYSTHAWIPSLLTTRFTYGGATAYASLAENPIEDKTTKGEEKRRYFVTLIELKYPRK